VTSKEPGAVFLTEHDGTTPGGLVAIVADRRLLLAALTALLLREPGYRVIQEVWGLADLTEALRSSRPAVVVVESSQSGWAGSINPALWGGRILLLLDPDDEPAVFVAAARAGVPGYLSRTASRETFTSAIETIRTKGHYVDGLLGQRFLSALREADRFPVARRQALTQHERDILVRLARGRSNKEIAREYAITPKTVANLVTNMYQKLNLKHRGELVLYAAQEGLSSRASPDGMTSVPFKEASPVG
jgi:DNA-binding NarL/FixJ family response regulator